MDTIPAILRAAASTYGDRPAYVEGDHTATFAQLLEAVRGTAAGYRELGLAPGDRLVLWAPNSIDWVVAALATSYAGATLVPANSRYTGHEVADLADRTQARLLVLADGFLGRNQIQDVRAASALESVENIVCLPGHGAPSADDVVDFTELVSIGTDQWEDIDRVADRVSPDDVADILFTSGTTGRPKGAMSAHRQTVGVARTWAEIGGVTADDRYLALNPFFHSFGYKAGIVVGLVTGAALHPLATFDLERTMEMVERERITVLPGAPTVFQSLLQADRSGRDLSSLRLAVTGAAVIPVVLVEQMRAPVAEGGLGIDRVLTAFGMTEAVVVTMCRGDEPPETIATTSGRAVPGMETRIDSTSPSEPGELLVRGDHVMLGYLDDPEATAEAIDADGWLHTGDIGTLDEHGNLRITDRLKDMYVSGGFNVYPAEVEQALLRLDGVDDVAVVGVPDERLGEVGRAYVVGDTTADQVIAHARERLANFKVPRSVELVDALPRNLSGKVLKNQLRATGTQDSHERGTA